MSDLATKLVKAAVASQNATTDFGTIAAVPGWCTRIVVEVALDTASILYVKFAGGQTLALNNGNQLAINTLYAFTLSVDPAEAVTFQLQNTAQLQRFLVDGMPGGV